jgi:hypothetical protein
MKYHFRKIKSVSNLKAKISEDKKITGITISFVRLSAKS